MIKHWLCKQEDLSLIPYKAARESTLMIPILEGKSQADPGGRGAVMVQTAKPVWQALCHCETLSQKGKVDSLWIQIVSSSTQRVNT